MVLMTDVMMDPSVWFWQVAGRTDFWSSAVGAYIEALPDGQGFTRIASEAELTDVLAVYGLFGPLPPDRVTSRQFKMQLSIAGLLPAVEAWIETQGDLVRIAYANSGTFVRSEPMMHAGMVSLGFSDEQIDEFFREAAKL